MCNIKIQSERMEQVHVFKFLEYKLNNRDLGKVECENKVMYGWVEELLGKLELMNKKRLSLKCLKVLHKSLPNPTVMYQSETIV